MLNVVVLIAILPGMPRYQSPDTFVFRADQRLGFKESYRHEINLDADGSILKMLIEVKSEVIKVNRDGSYVLRLTPTKKEASEDGTTIALPLQGSVTLDIDSDRGETEEDTDDREIDLGEMLRGVLRSYDDGFTRKLDEKWATKRRSGITKFHLLSRELVAGQPCLRLDYTATLGEDDEKTDASGSVYVRESDMSIQKGTLKAAKWGMFGEKSANVKADYRYERLD